MPKIAILTFHRACNYGAVLQAYALQTALNSLENVDAYLLDYDSKNVYDIYHPLYSFQRKAHSFKSRVNNVLLLPGLIKRNQYFAAFQSRFFRIERANVTRETLLDACKDLDCVIVGSDQVWNSEITCGDQSYLLEFAPEGVKKFSYAASVARENITENEVQNLAKSLRGIETISLREPDLVPHFRQVLADKEIRCDIDPVFLLGAVQWRSIAVPPHRSHYVLYFTLDSSRKSIPVKDFAKRLARQEKLSVVYLSNFDYWYRFRDIDHFGIADPSQFIGAIDAAEYVVTNSFHGIAFSILLHKPFFVSVLNDNIASRIRNLLEISGLTDRMLRNGVMEREPAPIDWDAVDAHLAGFIHSSEQYLKKIASVLAADSHI